MGTSEVAHSNGGEYHQYAIVLGLPEQMVASDLKLRFDGASGDGYGLMKDADSGLIVLKDPAKDNSVPFYPSFVLHSEPVSGEGAEDEEHLKAMAEMEHKSFAKGFAYGIGYGGTDMVTSAGETIAGVAKFGGRGLLGIGLACHWLGTAVQGQDTTEIENLIIELGEPNEKIVNQGLEMGRFLGKLFVESEAVLGLLEVGLLTGDLDLIKTAAHGGETHQLIFGMVTEVLFKTMDDYSTGTPGQKGYVAGRIFFEAASILIPAEALTKISKAKFLEDLATRGGAVLKAGARAVADTLSAALKTTKMCFVAGVLVHCQVEGAVRLEPIGGLEALASAHPDLKVWAQDEFTGQAGWKRPVAWFTTHPEELCHLGYDVDGDGQADETLSGTAPHPFWIAAREKFVPMGELKAGDMLTTFAGKVATVTTNTRKRALPGQTFTTYNFEVEDFHTYFVGEAGVWVHNTGGAECERVFSVWHRFRERGDEIWDAYLRTSTRLPNATDDILKKTMKEVSDIHKAERAGWSNIDLPQDRVQHTFDRHKDHWGFDAADNWNPANGDILKQKIQHHITDAATDVAEGKYRGNPATFFVNNDTGLAVVKNAAGELTAAFKFSSQQKHYLLKKTVGELMKLNTNYLKEAVALLDGCASGRVTIEEFAETYFHLTEGNFSVASQLPSACTDKEEIEELFSALRSDCAQFQPNPELFAEMMKTAAYPDEFLNQEGLRKRVEDALAMLRRAGISESHP